MSDETSHQTTSTNGPNLVTRECCPVCAGRKSNRLLEVSYRSPALRDYLARHYPASAGELDLLDNHAFELRECATCSLMYQTQVPGPDFVLRLYERWVEADEGFSVSKRNRKVEYFARHADEIVDVLTALGKNSYDVRVMDYGFGWGHWSRLVKGFGCEVDGYELSDQRQQCADEIGINVVAWEEIPGQDYDWIYSNQVFEHLVEPLSTLRHLAEGLRPGGVVSIGVPSGLHIKKLLAGIAGEPDSKVYDRLGVVMPLEHINCFPQRALFHLAQAAGLTPTRIVQRPRVQSFGGAIKAALRPTYHRLIGLKPGQHVFVKSGQGQ